MPKQCYGVGKGGREEKGSGQRERRLEKRDTTRDFSLSQASHQHVPLLPSYSKPSTPLRSYAGLPFLALKKRRAFRVFAGRVLLSIAKQPNERKEEKYRDHYIVH